MFNAVLGENYPYINNDLSRLTHHIGQMFAFPDDDVVNLKNWQHDLDALTDKLKSSYNAARIDLEDTSSYNAARINLEDTIRWLNIGHKKSPLIAYSEEILKLTKLQIISEFGDTKTPGDMPRHQLTETLTTAKKAIEACANQDSSVNDLLTHAENCTILAAKLAPPDRVKISTGKKIGGILLGIAGVLLIAASAAIAVATYGAATPLSIAGVSLGLSCIAARAAMGTVAAVSGIGLFKDRKPHPMKIKEFLEKIAAHSNDKKKDDNQAAYNESSLE